MTTKFVAELIIALVLTAIVAGLAIHRRRSRPRHLGFDLMLVGFRLVTIAAWLDFSDLHDAHAPGSAAAQSLLAVELGFGYLIGILLVGADQQDPD